MKRSMVWTKNLFLNQNLNELIMYGPLTNCKLTIITFHWLGPIARMVAMDRRPRSTGPVLNAVRMVIHSIPPTLSPAHRNALKRLMLGAWVVVTHPGSGISRKYEVLDAGEATGSCFTRFGRKFANGCSCPEGITGSTCAMANFRRWTVCTAILRGHETMKHLCGLRECNAGKET